METKRSLKGSELGELADPLSPLGQYSIDHFDLADLWALYRKMLTIRLVEEEIGRLVESGKVLCPCHLAIGQEAIPAGVSQTLTHTDRIFGGHRSHGHYLAAGGDIYQLLAEVLGRVTGCSLGMGGSMHLIAPQVGFCGSVPIVGGSIPIAVGAALASKKDGKGGVAVAYFGDGATEEGVFHESMNFAAVFKLPVLFVCENNLYSSHLDITDRQPSDRLARYAEAHRMVSATVDGNDVLAVAKVGGELIAQCRGGSPAFIETVTYRWRGHVGPREDLDVGVRRSAAEVDAWKMRDPLETLKMRMIQGAVAVEPEFSTLYSEVFASVEKASAEADLADYPDPSFLLSRVYDGR